MRRGFHARRDLLAVVPPENAVHIVVARVTSIVNEPLLRLCTDCPSPDCLDRKQIKDALLCLRASLTHNDSYRVCGAEPAPLTIPTLVFARPYKDSMR